MKATPFQPPYTGNPLIEEMSHTLYDAFSAFRTSAGLKAVPWEETSEVTQRIYFSAVTTLLAAYGPKVFGRVSIAEPRHLTRLERLLNWWRAFKERHIIGDDPHPDVSQFRRKEGTPAS